MNFSHLQYLCISNTTLISNEHIMCLFTNNKEFKLKTLKLPRCYNISDEAIEAIVANCTSIVNLSLEWCYLITEKCIVETLVPKMKEYGNLQSLNLSHIFFMKFDSLAIVMRELSPQLKKLKLNHCTGVNNDSLKYLYRSFKSGTSDQLIQALQCQTRNSSTWMIPLPPVQCNDSFKPVQIGQDVSTKTEHQLEIYQLQLSHCSQLTNIALMCLLLVPGIVQNLTTLDVSFCNSLHSSSFTTLLTTPFLKLKSLSVAGNVQVNNSHFINDSMLAPLLISTLEILNISYCDNITSIGYTSGISKFTKLKSLTMILHSPLVADVEIATTLKQLEQLEHLNLTRSFTAGKEVLRVLNEDLKQLKYLDLSNVNSAMVQLLLVNNSTIPPSESTASIGTSSIDMSTGAVGYTQLYRDLSKRLKCLKIHTGTLLK